MTDWMLEAAPAPSTAAAKPVTARQLTTPTTATFLAARRLTRCAKIAVLFVSISDAPWQGNYDGQHVPLRSLVRNERHYLMDKKSDHPCKHSQRDSFIDTRAASHCYAFHSFPHPDDSASRHMQSRCTASVNEALSTASEKLAMICLA
jgi:hypothetical protein